MGTSGYLSLHLLGAALLGLWLDARLGERRPTSRRAVVAAVATAFLAMQAVKLVATSWLSPEAPLRSLVLLFAVVLPAWAYTFLASIWVLKVLRDALETRYR
jgi:hypothetical protein